jgi:hypothetical protein
VATTLHRSVSSIAFPEASYTDNFVVYKQVKSKLEQQFNVNSINALSGALDARINNYSSFYISSENLLSNFIELSTFRSEVLQTLTTKLYFNRGIGEDPRYLYIYENNSLSATIEQKPVGMELLGDIRLLANNYNFELEFLDERLLRIKHNNGRRDYFLNYDGADGLVFYNYNSDVDLVTTERNDTFRYSVDSDGYLQLYKVINNSLKVLTLSANSLTFDEMQVGSLNRNLNNLINIDYTNEVVPASLNNSFISYINEKKNSLIIDTAESSLDLKGQYALYTNYNKISAGEVNLNYFNLDNNRSEFNFIKRGSNMSNSPFGIPVANPREYNSLHTGNEQERGTEKIQLNYVFYDKDIMISNGTDTFFNAPSSIYPYKRLNVNDTTFALNGAFAGPSPILSDKFFVKRANSGQYNNGRYLCTWLSAGNLNQKGIWVDRYYYPDKITKKQALSSNPYFNPSFEDSVDSIALGTPDLTLNKEKFFDKKSDAAITPNISLKYNRIGRRDVDDIVFSSSPLMSAFDNYYISKKIGNEVQNLCYSCNKREFDFDGTFYSRLSVFEKINKSKAFTISFDMWIDPSIHHGYQLLGNNTNAGFGLFQDQTSTPFLHVVSGNDLYIYNSNYELLNKVNFIRKIKDVFKRGALDEYIITCNGNLFYRVDPQGNKLRLECSSEILDYIGYHQEDEDIDFIDSRGEIHRLNVQSLESKTVSATEIDVYKDAFCLYDNVVIRDGVDYKLPGAKTRWEDNDTIFYVTSNYVVKHNLRSSPQAFLKSSTPISDINIEGNIISIASESRLYQYNTTGAFTLSADIASAVTDAKTQPLSSGSIITIDYVNQYINGDQNFYTTLLCKSDNKDLYMVTGVGSQLSATKLVGAEAGSVVKSENNTKNVFITNYNNLNRMFDADSLDFKLTLQNYLDSQDYLTEIISFNKNTLTKGYHNFTFRFDSIQGNMTLYIDGALYKNINLSPGKYKIQNIFKDELFIGSAGFQDGLDLATYLKQPGYFYAKGMEIKNLFIYDRAINTTLVYALYLLEQKIDDIVLSIPAGQHANKTQIERYFKFGRHNSSNSIDIVVKDLPITDKETISELKTSILAEASSILPIGTKINDIKFINYS